MNGKLAPFFILFAAVLWGTTGTAQTFAPEAAHPVAVGAARLAVGGVFLLILVFLTGGLSLTNWPLRATFLAALSMALFQPLFFTAVTVTGVAIGTVVAIGSAPVLSGFLEWLFLKRLPSRIWWSSTFLSILGCLMLFLNKDSVVVDPIGVLMALGAGLSFAVYAIVSRDLAGKFPSLSIVAVVFTLSAVFLAPFMLVFDMTWVTDVRGWSIVLYLGVMTTGVAYILFARGLMHVSSSTAVTLALAEPLTAALFGVFLLGENLNATSWIGMVLLLLGIGLLIIGTNGGANGTDNSPRLFFKA
ncbi:EamA family transporter [Sutcliffiella horikoshii]|uniref:EamA family transporter n=1 Tax=Sutcliffiella horikoshii TaxID=79883 RepID=A0A1Y0CU90_9BACI|nr:EamA family transporter [Sutcliffiella horikoshii]ART78435.1 EamA family transporter [Sutcliffiella horikoshii]TYS59631.1 EamA family transporter [Sutcliffiella horikoshii]